MTNTLLVKKSYTFQNLLVQNLSISLAVGPRLGNFVENFGAFHVLHDLENLAFELISIDLNCSDYILVMERLQNLKLSFVSNYFFLVVVSNNFYCERLVLVVLIVGELAREQRRALV